MRNFDKYNDFYIDQYEEESLRLPIDIDNLNYFLDKLEEKLDIKIGNLLGVGFEGQVYSINDNRVLKIKPRFTDDLTDINTQLYLKGKDIKHVSKVYEVGLLKNKTKKQLFFNTLNDDIYYVILERLTINEKLKMDFMELEECYTNFIEDKFHRTPELFANGDNALSFIEDIIDYDEGLLNEFIEYSNNNDIINQVTSLIKNLKEHNIEYDDLMVQNIGYKDKLLKAFDIGGYNGDDDISVAKEFIIK